MKGFSFFSVLFLVFIVWVTIGKNHGERIERACAPVGWTGNVSVSLFSLAGTKVADTAQDVFDRATYGCEYASWRLVFENRYLDVVKTYIRTTGVEELSAYDQRRIGAALEYENIPNPPITVEQRKAIREEQKEKGYGKTYNFVDNPEGWE